jgi:hypothetical protein
MDLVPIGLVSINMPAKTSLFAPFYTYRTRSSWSAGGGMTWVGRRGVPEGDWVA